jgi:hypothetical protein
MSRRPGKPPTSVTFNLRAKVSHRLYLMTRLLVNAEVDRRAGPVLQCDLSNSANKKQLDRVPGPGLAFEPRFS